jgi:GntP family gluconate:H+ symporter
MDILFILAVGVMIVVGGILVFRLHAFLALILAALAVASLTSTDSVTWYKRTEAAGTLAAVQPDEVIEEDRSRLAEPGQYLLLTPGKGQYAGDGTKLLVFAGKPEKRSADAQGQIEVLGTVHLVPGADSQPRQGILVRVIDGSVESGDRALGRAQWEATAKAAKQLSIDRVASAFGTTCGSIGIVIAMASIIGKCLLESGAADRIIRSLLGLLGEARAALAFVLGGFALGIPVFFDTVFYLMIPLGKALRIRTGRNYLLYVLGITAGGTMAHSLVPPTPGPLVIAEQLGVNIGAMMIGGCVVGIFASTSGYLYALWANRRWEIPLRDTEDAKLEDLEKLAHRDASELPGLFVSMLPIALPVILIGGATLFDPKVTGVVVDAQVKRIIDVLGDKNIALVISAAIAMLTMVLVKKADKHAIGRDVQSALASGGVIILITAAGGAFGSMLKETGIGEMIAQASPSGSPLLVLPMAFAIAALVRTAQGSATVAMITAGGILAGLPDFGFHRVYLALAIGCGSKPFPWMNDSGFWVICKMSGMTEGEMLKTVSPMVSFMGVVGLIVTMIGAVLFPLT